MRDERRGRAAYKEQLPLHENLSFQFSPSIHEPYIFVIDFGILCHHHTIPTIYQIDQSQHTQCLNTRPVKPSATSPLEVRSSSRLPVSLSCCLTSLIPSYHYQTSTNHHHLGPDSNTSESTGVIKAVATEPANLADRNVNASEDEPTYEVRCFRPMVRISKTFG